MNLREGMRRLALLLGVVVAVVGGTFSNMELKSVISERAEFKRFEQLANSSVVQQERKSCFSDNPPPGYAKRGNQLQENRAGIEAIEWSDDCSVSMIKTVTSEWLYPGLAPRSWEFSLIALLPIFGFLIPWGAVRAIGWVLTGFVQGQRRRNGGERRARGTL